MSSQLPFAYVAFLSGSLESLTGRFPRALGPVSLEACGNSHYVKRNFLIIDRTKRTSQCLQGIEVHPARVLRSVR